MNDTSDMNDTPNPEAPKENDELQKLVSSVLKDAFSEDALKESSHLASQFYQLWWLYADFELFIISPTLQPIAPPQILMPEPIGQSGEVEFVYPIVDHGFRMATSKGHEMFAVGYSNCKLFYTIEKMVTLLVERLKSGNVTAETEVQVAFSGHELAERKAFESIINLGYNVVVTNFDPGPWGEHYLETVKHIASKGYGYPSEAPRDIYKVLHGTSKNAKPSGA